MAFELCGFYPEQHSGRHGSSFLESGKELKLMIMCG